jgi:hypothetical protein
VGRLRIGNLKPLFRRAPSATRYYSPPPAAAARARCWRLPQHPAAARRSSAQPGVARLCAVWTCRSRWVTVERQGFPGVEVSKRPVGKSWGGRFQTGFHRCKRAKYTAAARTSPMDPRWRGLRRTRISLSEGELEQWEGGRTPAGEISPAKPAGQLRYAGLRRGFVRRGDEAHNLGDVIFEFA